MPYSAHFWVRWIQLPDRTRGGGGQGNESMKKTVLMILALLLLLSGCGGKAETVAAEGVSPAQDAQSASGAKAEAAEDSAWARSRPAAPAETVLLLHQSEMDSQGRILSYTDYTYNADGRLLKETPRDADGNVSTEDYVYSFDYEYVNGYLTAKNARTADGRMVYRYKYDEAGREFKWILYDENGSVRQWYVDTYDTNGNIVTHTMYLPEGEERLMNTREYDYDEAGRVTECRYLSSTGTVLNRYVYRYVTDAAGRVIEYEQDDMGAGMLVEWYRYEYNADGTLAVRRQLDGGERCVIREEYEYDAEGRVIRKRIYESSGALAVVVENLWGRDGNVVG